MKELGLPEEIKACLFDLDGVVTRTAVVHAAAWKEMFDAFLRDREGDRFRPFDGDDYDTYVDGLPRADGVRTFLASRGIELPDGKPDDPPSAETVHGLGNRKNALVLEKIRTDGVEAYDDTLTYIRAARARGLRTAIVSSSANCRDVLRAIDAEDLFDVRIDGVVAAERGLPGKPHPTPSSPPPTTWAWTPPGPPSSRTPSPAWTPAAPEASATSSASTGWDRATRSTSTAPTSS
jgi:beta-phosphoglucomutase-like phosphatase (HAD superfamily)